MKTSDSSPANGFDCQIQATNQEREIPAKNYGDTTNIDFFLDISTDMPKKLTALSAIQPWHIDISMRHGQVHAGVLLGFPIPRNPNIISGYDNPLDENDSPQFTEKSRHASTTAMLFTPSRDPNLSPLRLSASCGGAHMWHGAIWGFTHNVLHVAMETVDKNGGCLRVCWCVSRLFVGCFSKPPFIIG